MQSAGRLRLETRQSNLAAADADCSKDSRGQQAGGNRQHGDMELGVARETRCRIPTVERLQHRSEQGCKKQRHQSAPEEGSDHEEILQDTGGMRREGFDRMNSAVPVFRQ